MTDIHEQRLKKWLQVLDENDPEMSRIAAEKLGELGDAVAVKPLIRALEKRTAVVAAAAAHALGRLGDKQATGPLINALDRHTDVLVQTAAAESLGKLRSTDAVPSLKRHIEDYLRESGTDRLSLTRGFRRGLFTTCIASLKLIGTRDAVRFAEKAEHSRL